MNKFLFLSLIILFVFACKKDSTHSLAGGNAGILGIVTDENGLPVSEANVSLGTLTTATDKLGVFIFSNLSLPEKNAVIHVSKQGYLNGTKTIVRPTSNINNVRITLLGKQLSTVLNAANGGIFTDGFIQVTFPPNSIQNSDGTLYSGMVNVYSKYLNPDDLSLANKIPGELVGQNISGEEKILRTYGMMNIILEDNAGNLLNIANNKKAKIEMIVPSSLQANAPSTIPLWHFDDNKGLWMEEGEATLISGKYVGEVAHFSWWNCDIPVNSIALSLTLQDASGHLLSNVQTKLTDLATGRVGYGFTDNMGVVSGMVPSNSTLKLEIENSACHNYIFVQNINPLSTATSLSLVIPGITGLNYFSGKIVDCNNKPLANEYVYVSYGLNSFIVPTGNEGNFSFILSKCSAADSTFCILTIKEILSNSILHCFDSNLPSQDLGTLHTECGLPSVNFLEYRLNNGPLVRFESSDLQYHNRSYIPDTIFAPDYLEEGNSIITDAHIVVKTRTGNTFSLTNGAFFLSGVIATIINNGDTISLWNSDNTIPFLVPISYPQYYVSYNTFNAKFLKYGSSDTTKQTLYCSYKIAEFY